MLFVYAGLDVPLGSDVAASVRFSLEILTKHDENDMPPEVFDALKKFVRWRRTVGQGK